MTRRYGWTLTITEVADEDEAVPGHTTHTYGSASWLREISPGELLRIIVLAAGDALDGPVS